MSFLALREEIVIGQYSLIIKERIAEGGYGFVDLAVHSQNNLEYALKRCGIQRQENFDIVNKEVTMLQKFKGTFVINLLASEMNKQKKEAILLMEYCPGGHLLSRLNARNNDPLSLKDTCRIFGQLLLAIRPMHACVPPVVHRDIKLENVLFGKDGNLKLCDFGSCVTGYISLRTPEEKSKAEEIIQKETTQMYRAPEMIDLYLREELTEKTDIWALGCIFYALCYMTHPFQDAGNLGILGGKLQLPNDSHFPEDCRVVIGRMLDMDPEARPSVVELLDMISCINQGQELPPYEISDVAKERRREREESQKRKQMATTKKPINVVPIREVAVPLSADSVAARRLAAKKAGSQVGTLTAQINLGTVKKPTGSGFLGSANDGIFQSSSNRSEGQSNLLDMMNDDVQVSSNASSKPNDSFDLFSAGSSDGTSDNKPSNKNNEFDIFGSTGALDSTTSTKSYNANSTDDIFGTNNAAKSNSATTNTFDIFDAQTSTTSTNNTFNMFDSKPNNTSTNTFDAFDSKPTSNAKSDLFGDNDVLSLSNAPPKASVASVLSMFDQVPKKSAPSDPFAMLPQGPGQKYPQQNPGGMYGGNPFMNNAPPANPFGGGPMNNNFTGNSNNMNSNIYGNNQMQFTTQKPASLQNNNDPFGSLDILRKK